MGLKKFCTPPSQKNESRLKMAGNTRTFAFSFMLISFSIAFSSCKFYI